MLVYTWDKDAKTWMEESHDLRIQANRSGELANGFLSSRIPCARVKPLLLVVDGGATKRQGAGGVLLQ